MRLQTVSMSTGQMVMTECNLCVLCHVSVACDDVC